MTDGSPGSDPGPPRNRLGSLSGLRAMASRLSWGVADQAVSSLTNFAVGATVASSLGTTAFGAFSLAWVTYAVVLNLSRGLGSDPLMVRFSGDAGPAWRAASRQAAGSAVLVGIVLGLISVAGGTVVGGVVGGGFVALGLVLPLLLLQDCWRFVFFAAGQGRRACLNDLVWAASLVPGLLLVRPHGSVFLFVLAWGLAAGVAALFGLLQLRVVPTLSGARAWLRDHRELGPRYMIDNVCLSAASQLRMYGLGALAGLTAVGALRGGMLLMGPFLATVMGLAVVAVPEAARMLRRSGRHLVRFCVLFGVAQTAAATVWGLGLLLLPDSVGHAVLGEVWDHSSRLIVPVTTEVIGSSWITAASAGLRALGAARRSVRAQLAASAVFLAGGLLGAWLDGAHGSAWGSACAVLLTGALWWRQLWAGIADREAAAPDEVTSDLAGPDPAAHIDTLDSTEMRKR